jgi:hypothetical protein
MLSELGRCEFRLYAHIVEPLAVGRLYKLIRVLRPEASRFFHRVLFDDGIGRRDGSISAEFLQKTFTSTASESEGVTCVPRGRKLPISTAMPLLFFQIAVYRIWRRRIRRDWFLREINSMEVISHVDGGHQAHKKRALPPDRACPWSVDALQIPRRPSRGAGAGYARQHGMRMGLGAAAGGRRPDCRPSWPRWRRPSGGRLARMRTIVPALNDSNSSAADGDLATVRVIDSVRDFLFGPPRHSRRSTRLGPEPANKQTLVLFRAARRDRMPNLSRGTRYGRLRRHREQSRVARAAQSSYAQAKSFDTA